MGSAPNAATSADVKHPVSQGFDPNAGCVCKILLLCTCTAVIILLSGNYGGEQLKNISNNPICFTVPCR